MGARIAVIQGHPDARGGHLGHALADAYADAAREEGHEVRHIDVASLQFPILRSKDEWEGAAPSPDIARAQQTLDWASHLLIVYPLWLGSMPALLKGFLEQVLRPDFAIAEAGSGRYWRACLSGRSARIVVTMGMPAFVYRWYFRLHSLKALQRNVLELCGVKPIAFELFGMVEKPGPPRIDRWLRRMRKLGARAA
jgi:putative NADPH-quinone reductase